jgi:DNA-binding XRE family transcriptional regulator
VVSKERPDRRRSARRTSESAKTGEATKSPREPKIAPRSGRSRPAMTMSKFEQTVLSRSGARKRVAEIEHRLLIAQALGELRRRRHISTRAMARRLGVSQPRVVAIERSEDLTIGTVARYAEALGGRVEIAIVTEDDTTVVRV